jgi:hypothetical protein
MSACERERVQAHDEYERGVRGGRRPKNPALAEWRPPRWPPLAAAVGAVTVFDAELTGV